MGSISILGFCDVGTTMLNRSSHIPSTTKTEAIVVPRTPRVLLEHIRPNGMTVHETTINQKGNA